MARRQGHFGPYGGRYVPETLMHRSKLRRNIFRAQQPGFHANGIITSRNFAVALRRFNFARTPDKELGGAKIYLKREDLRTPCAHKINNAIGSLRRKRMGKRAHRRYSAGQPASPRGHRRRDVRDEMRHLHGRVDCERQILNFIAENAGAEVVAGPRGAKTLKEPSRGDARLGHEPPQHCITFSDGLRAHP